MHTPVSLTSLNAVSATGAGATRQMRGAEFVTVELNWSYTAAPTGVEVRLEGRIGTGNWTQIGAAMTDVPAGATSDDFMYTFNRGHYGEIRLRLVTLTGGTAPVLTGTITLGGGD